MLHSPPSIPNISSMRQPPMSSRSTASCAADSICPKTRPKKSSWLLSDKSPKWKTSRRGNRQKLIFVPNKLLNIVVKCLILYDSAFFFIASLSQMVCACRKTGDHLQTSWFSTSRASANERGHLDPRRFVGGDQSVAAPFRTAIEARHPRPHFSSSRPRPRPDMPKQNDLSRSRRFSYLPLDFSLDRAPMGQKLQPKTLYPRRRRFLAQFALCRQRKRAAKSSSSAAKSPNDRHAALRYFRFFSKKLFGSLRSSLRPKRGIRRPLSLLCVDPPASTITGNLKLDIDPQRVDPRRKVRQQSFSISDHRLAITVSCTHALKKRSCSILPPSGNAFLFVFLAPRHPERFDEVAQILQVEKYPFVRWSQPAEKRGGERSFSSMPWASFRLLSALPPCHRRRQLSSQVSAATISSSHASTAYLFFSAPTCIPRRSLSALVLEAKAGMQVTYRNPARRSSKHSFNSSFPDEAARY